MDQLIEISKNLLKNCLGLKEKESFLVVTDEEKQNLATKLFAAGKSMGAEAMLMVMQTREKSGEEPPDTVAAAMSHAQVVICITEHSLTHTKARKQAAAAGARLATMPGITEDMFLEGAVAADYSKVKALTERVSDVLTRGKEVRIEKDWTHAHFFDRESYGSFQYRSIRTFWRIRQSAIRRVFSRSSRGISVWPNRHRWIRSQESENYRLLSC